MNEQPDPLRELLQPLPRREPMELRDQVRAQTSRIVRRRLIARRVAAAGALAACLMAAALAGYFLRPNSVSRREVPFVVDAPRPPELPVVEIAQEPMANPVELEWQAFDSQKNRAASYFLAGNKYLEASDDVESALRCYTQALDACTPEQLEITPEDNWLVVTLKNARLKERNHE
jgi:hypothetical protein